MVKKDNGKKKERKEEKERKEKKKREILLLSGGCICWGVGPWSVSTGFHVFK